MREVWPCPRLRWEYPLVTTTDAMDLVSASLTGPMKYVEQPQHARFIGPHLAAEADDVGEHDGGQAPRLCGPRAGAVLWHGGDYRIGGL